MNELLLPLLLVTVIAVIAVNREAIPIRKEEGYDGQGYPVLDLPRSKRAADILADINRRNLALIRYLETMHPQGTRAGKLAKTLRRRYRSRALRENDPPDTANTSFTIDKGRILALCLRDQHNKQSQFHKINLIQFVDIHEMAHIASLEYGHQDEFWSNFKFLLQEAVKLGIYYPHDYAKNPVDYCGLMVNYNPLFDDTQESCCA